MFNADTELHGYALFSPHLAPLATFCLGVNDMDRDSNRSANGDGVRDQLEVYHLAGWEWIGHYVIER